MLAERFSLTVKAVVCASAILVMALAGPHLLNRHIETFWVEEAHQALLTSLVEARNTAWEERTTVKLCMADSKLRCIEPGASGASGWLVLRDGKDSENRVVAFHRFHAEFVALSTSERNLLQRPLGFDAEGYSLQNEVIAFAVHSWSGNTDKTYTVLVEPSGALQTLINAPIRSPVAVAADRWQERARAEG